MKPINIPQISKAFLPSDIQPLSSDREKNKKNVRFSHNKAESANIEKSNSSKMLFFNPNASKIMNIHKKMFNIEEIQQNEDNVQDIKNLDRWVNNIQTLKDVPININSPSNDQKKIITMNTPSSQKKLISEYGMPDLRQKIIHSIFKDEEEENNQRLEEIKNIRDRSKLKNFKSLDTKKMEINESLLNDLLYRKIQKKISHSKDLKSKIDIKNDIVINDTIYNFKSLENLCKMRSPINYENIMKKVDIDTKNIERIFDFSEDIEKIEQEKKDVNNLEPIFLEKFKELQELIESKKKVVEKIRITIGNNQNKLISEKNYLEKLQNKIQTGFENHGKESSPAMRNSPRDKNKYWAQKEKKEELGDFIKINKLMEDRKKAIEHEYMEIKRIKDQMALNKESLIKLEADIKNLRKRKTFISLKLKDLYMKKLKEGTNESLVWIIKAFWNMNEEISGDIFPTFLDQGNIQYLFEMAKLEKKIDDAKKLSKPLLHRESNKFSNEGSPNISMVKFINDKSEICQRMKNAVKTTKVSSINNTTALTLMRNRTFTYEPKNEISDEVEEPINEENPGLYDIVVKNKNIENEIKHMVDYVNDLMKNETDRVFMIYFEIAHEEKNLGKFKNILKALFGLKEAEKKLETFFKLLNDNNNKGNSKNVPMKAKDRKNSNEKMKLKNLQSRTRTKTEIDSTFLNRFKKNLFLNLNEEMVNYSYNVSYNYYPPLQNSSLESTYYKHNNY